MDLTPRLRRAAFARPHLYMVALPGGTAVRLAVERLANRRGWPVALSPADADVLCVCGPLTEGAREVVDRLWAQVPPPRTRRELSDEGAVHAALEAAEDELREGRAEPAGPLPRGDHTGGHEGQRDGGREGHGGHEGHAGHGGMRMPGGLAMADRAHDRDGLKLDRLHVPLGPALPLWPAGLTLRLALQGDVVQDVRLDVPYGGGHHSYPFWEEPWLRSLAGEAVPVTDAERRRAAAHLDSLSRLLALAGGDGAAAGCARLRDDLLTGAPTAQVERGFAPLARRLRRSRLLRWMTDGLGVVDGKRAAAYGVSGPALRATGTADEERQRSDAYRGSAPPVAGDAGDVTARLWQWLVEVEVALDAARSASDDLVPVDGRLDGPRGLLGGDEPPSAALLRLLPRLLVGAELAAVRLIVASLDPDLESLSVHALVEAPGARC